MSDEPQVRFRIEPSNADYDPNDDRWIDQVNDLVNELQSEVGEVHKEQTAVSGMKGGMEVLELILGSVDVVSSAVDMFKAWLSRDQSRSLEITIERDGKKETISVSGNRIDKEDMMKFMEAAFQSSSING